MNSIKLTPRSEVKGVICAPYSKSYAQRAIAIASLSKSPTKIIGLNSKLDNDTKAAIETVTKLGGEIELNPESLLVKKGVNLSDKLEFKINIGESGLSSRVFSCFSLLTKSIFQITGKGSLMKRPMQMVIQALEKKGKKVHAKNDFLPLKIQGECNQNTIVIDSSDGSQILSGLLITMPLLPFNNKIIVKNLVSIPYIEMTLSILKDFGISVSHKNYSNFQISGNQNPKLETYSIEGDWSSISFFAVAAAICGDLVINNLDPNSKQADSEIIKILQKVGTNVCWLKGQKLRIIKHELKSFSCDLTHQPDLFPCLIILAIFCSGTSHLKGLKRLQNKESDRAKSMAIELKKININIELNYSENAINIVGDPNLILKKKQHFDSHNDHRIAMALSLLIYRSQEPIVISNHSSVNKSYPSFFEELNAVSL